MIANARIPLTMLRRGNSKRNLLTFKGDETLNKVFLEHKRTLQIDSRSIKFKFSNLLGSSLDEKSLKEPISKLKTNVFTAERSSSGLSPNFQASFGQAKQKKAYDKGKLSLPISLVSGL